MRSSKYHFYDVPFKRGVTRCKSFGDHGLCVLTVEAGHFAAGNEGIGIKMDSERVMGEGSNRKYGSYV